MVADGSRYESACICEAAELLANYICILSIIMHELDNVLDKMKGRGLSPG